MLDAVASFRVFSCTARADLTQSDAVHVRLFFSLRALPTVASAKVSVACLAALPAFVNRLASSCSCIPVRR